MATTKKAGAQEVQTDRRSDDRRKQEVPVTVERRKKQRRRQIDPTTCERDYSGDEIEFMHALDDYKRRSGRMFPTCSEILEVIRDLGYVRLDAEADPAATDTVIMQGAPIVGEIDELDDDFDANDDDDSVLD